MLTYADVCWQPVFMHFLRATLGDEVKISHVVSSLNPNFFWVAKFDQCLIPGPSQLKLELLDGKFSMGRETDSELIGTQFACFTSTSTKVQILTP